MCYTSAFGQRLGVSWAPLERNLDPTWRLLGRSWAQLERSWPPLGPDLEPLGRLLESTWTLLGTSWTQLAASWSQLGLERRLLESTWTLLGISWTQLGASWAPLGANLDALGHLLGSTRILSRASCTTRGSASSNTTSVVPPQGLPTAIVLRCQRNFSSPDGDICNTSIIYMYICIYI